MADGPEGRPLRKGDMRHCQKGDGSAWHETYLGDGVWKQERLPVPIPYPQPEPFFPGLPMPKIKPNPVKPKGLSFEETYQLELKEREDELDNKAIADSKIQGKPGTIWFVGDAAAALYSVLKPIELKGEWQQLGPIKKT